MNENILVRLEIPIPIEPVANPTALVFYKWLPLTEDEFMVIQKENATLKFWFDRTCLNHVFDIDVSEHSNVLVKKIYADVFLQNISSKLIDYIRETANKSQPEDSPFKQGYEELGEKVHLLVMTHLNRLIAYIRCEKGQYWVSEYPVPEREHYNLGIYQYNVIFNAKVVIDSKWYRWYPTNRGGFKVKHGEALDKSRYIDKEAWQNAKEFIASQRQASLVWELLSGAEWLSGIGHYRSALTEAVTALEVAVNAFAKDVNVNKLFGPLLSRRIGTNTLKNQVEHIGFSGTINYLLPIIFTEDQVFTDVLKSCQKAVLLRQNIVHNGQRKIDENEVLGSLRLIRQMCTILESFCKADKKI